jgi:glycosyltransferase involved in cell wall biosynthesis
MLGSIKVPTMSMHEIANAEIFVVIPAYNERAVLAQTLARLAPYGYSVVVVDDGSAVPELNYIRNGAENVWYLRHVSNLGAGAAVQTGTEFALLKGAKVVVHFDADGQHDPTQISKFVEPIRQGTCDVVMGSRFLNLEDRKLVPRKKRVLLKLGVVVSWLFTGVWLTDTHNGFRALSRTVAEQIKLNENGYAHCTEILEQIRKSGARYIEIPTTVRYTEYSMAKGQSMLNSVNIVFDLFLRKVLR